jgi:hypothetical protein
MLFLGSKHLAHASFSNIQSCAINNQTPPTRLVPLSKQMVAPIHRPPSHHWQTWASLSKQNVAPMHWPPTIIGKHRLLLSCLLDFSNNSIKIDFFFVC